MELVRTVYLLGAGASHGYAQSETGVRPPLATGLFEAYSQLDISGDMGVKVGWLVNYVRDMYGVPVERFGSFKMDAEAFMSSLESEVEKYADHKRRCLKYDSDEEELRASTRVAAFDQTLFLFTHIFNEIAKGPIYGDYATLSSRLGADDAIVTFNWDTLLDRAIFEMTPWSPDDGYNVAFHSIFDEGWRDPQSAGQSEVQFLKLHGSTNWLTPYVSRDLRTGDPSIAGRNPGLRSMAFNVETGDDLLSPTYKPTLTQHTYTSLPFTPDDLRPLCFLKGTKRFDAFRNRFRPGYGPFTYFYSPLDPDCGAPTSPILIAPVRHKTYEAYSKVLEPIWAKATSLIAQADRVIVIGFSFPPTDLRARSLFSPSERARSIEVVDPFPERPLSVLRELTGTDVSHVASSFTEFLGSP